jgi:hypothetical protein
VRDCSGSPDRADFPRADAIRRWTRARLLSDAAGSPAGGASTCAHYFTAAASDRLWVIRERLRVFKRDLRALTAFARVIAQADTRHPADRLDAGGGWRRPQRSPSPKTRTTTVETPDITRGRHRRAHAPVTMMRVIGAVFAGNRGRDRSLGFARPAFHTASTPFPQLVPAARGAMSDFEPKTTPITRVARPDNPHKLTDRPWNDAPA